ncbi:MAG TPA: hypothetical protein VFF83_05080 [Clostridia bacterium]|nr:hypothetical protein [Clostridia bacterium]
MKRITRKTQNNGHYVVDEDKIKQVAGGYSGEAVERLAAFENMYENLIKGQSEISEELERLRREGKKNSYKFRELMGKKLINSNTLIILKNYGLE